MRIIKYSLTVLFLSLFFFGQNASAACPVPTGNLSNNYGFERFRGYPYYIFFCQLPNSNTYNYKLKANDIGQLDRLNIQETIVGKALSNGNSGSGNSALPPPPSPSGIILTGTLDLTKLSINNKIVIELKDNNSNKNIFNFYSRINLSFYNRRCISFFSNEYNYITNYLRGGGGAGNSSNPVGDPSILFTAQAIPSGALKTGQAVNSGQDVAKITGIELKNASGTNTITGDLFFSINTNNSSYIVGNQRLCRIGLSVRLEINPQTILTSHTSPESYEVKIMVNNPR